MGAERRNPKGAERRSHKRVPGPFPCMLLGADKKEERFEIIDLSESGVRMRCARALAPMTEVRVALQLPGPRVGLKQDARVETRGVVVWSHKGAAGYDTGVFFPEVSRDQRAMLLAYVLSAIA